MTTTTLQPVSPNAVAHARQQEGFLDRLAALPLSRKLMLAGGVLALIAVGLAMGSWSRDASYKVLFANLSDKDGGAILAQLSQMNVPYKHAEGGSAILVPADKVHDVRLKLAQSGLPKGSTIGFELMDNARFGTTQFQERLNFQRGLEGELVRSITALSAVAAARVHLALPNQNGFFREQQKPSASVLLTLHNGRTLDRAQIAGIVHLVSASVPELHPKAVSVVDHTGALLSGPAEGLNTAGGLDANQLQYVNQIETNYTRRILDILEPIVGRDNLRAQVTAEVDFSQTESTSEEFKPNQGEAPAAVRSSQTSEASQAAAATPGGVPGAASNQPPTPATAPITGGAAPLQPAQAGGAAGGNNGRREAVVNYEVDKTVRVTRAATGNIRRLNAAVVVNHRSSTDAKGKVTTTALSADDLDKLTTLVQESVGYSKDRGDSVKVINAPFKVDRPVVQDLPLWKQPEVQDLVRTFAPGVGLGLMAMLIIFGAIRPAIKAAAETRVVVNEVVDDANELPQAPPPALPSPGQKETQERIEQMRRLAKENPAAVANIVRSWVNKD